MEYSISLPYNWKPRHYQRRAWEALRDGVKRVVLVWHRRAGKDAVCMYSASCAAFERPGNYWHMLPEADQCRKAIWEAVNPTTGYRRIDEVFPPDIRSGRPRNQEMILNLASGSTWQCVGSDNYNCYSDDTEILTQDGWKLFSDLSGNEFVATLENDYLVYSPINHIVSYQYNGMMYKVKNNAIDLLVTPNHKFYVESGKGVRKFKRIDNPTIASDKIPATCKWHGRDDDVFVLPEVVNIKDHTTVKWALQFDMKDWCAFMGIFLSEGSTFSDKKGNYRVHIAQTKPHICAKISELLTRMGLKYKYNPTHGVFTIQNRQLYEYCRQFGLCNEKFIPQNLKNLSVKYLEILIEWLVYGDGNINSNDTLSYASTSKKLIDDFQEIVIKTGYSGNIKTRNNNNNGGFIRGREIKSVLPLYVFYRRKSKFKYFRDTNENYISQIPYQGKVWCVDAGSHVIKVRRNGKEAWCGNSLIGASPVGIVWSEWSVADPSSWAYLSPILEENGGFALFPYTSRGENHGLSLYESASADPKWFCEKLTADDTGIFSQAQLDQALKDLVGVHGEALGTAMFQQEYYCSFSAPVLGAVYAAEMEKCEQEGRVRSDLYDPALPVYTAWDLGHSDSTAIWWYQVGMDGVRIIDWYENSQQDLAHYAGVVLGRRCEQTTMGGIRIVPSVMDAKHMHRVRYRYANHYLPPDARQKTLAASGLSVERQLAAILPGVQICEIPNDANLDASIQATRASFPRFYFDAQRTLEGRRRVRQYHYKYDARNKTLSGKPVHDWTSHSSTALHVLALSWRPYNDSQMLDYDDENYLGRGRSRVGGY